MRPLLILVLALRLLQLSRLLQFLHFQQSPKMDALLQQRRIQIWELLCQHYTIPKARQNILDNLIRQGEDIPPKLPTKK